MSSACGDVGREAVYAAELAAFDGTTFESVVPIDELRSIAASITALDWWPHGPIQVTAARSDARSSSTRVVGAQSPVVRLAAPQLTQATLVHEFAHVLAGVSAGHGPAFRRAHLDLVTEVFSNEAAQWLSDAYTSMGLEIAPRRAATVGHRGTETGGVVGDGFVMLDP